MKKDAERDGLVQVKVVLPTHVLLDVGVARLVAEAVDGSFGVLPRHVDFVASLRPGVLALTLRDGTELFVGHDVGIFVKQGREVLVSVRQAVRGTRLSELRQQVREELATVMEAEQTARSALARLETGIVRRFVDLERR